MWCVIHEGQENTLRLFAREVDARAYVTLFNSKLNVFFRDIL